VLFIVWAVLGAMGACYSVAEPVTEPAPQPRAPAVQLPDTGTADGASLTVVTVLSDPLTPAERRSISLTTTAGVFTSSGTAAATLLPDSDGSAVALLRAPIDSTIALVTATVNGVTGSRRITFRRAQPERVDVLPEQFALKAGVTNELNVTAVLSRTVGMPSPGVLVTFSASDTSAKRAPLGRFIAATVLTDASGVATTRFTTADSSWRGPVILRATTAAPSSVSGEAIVQVTPP
jgi:hypothetical protein